METSNHRRRFRSATGRKPIRLALQGGGSWGAREALFTMAKLEDFVPADHPLRPRALEV